MTNPARTAPRSAAWLTIGPADQPADSPLVNVQRLHETSEAALPGTDVYRPHLGADIGSAIFALTGADESHSLGALLAAYGRNVEVEVGRGMVLGYFPACPDSGLNLSTEEPDVYGDLATTVASIGAILPARSADMAVYVTNVLKS